MSVTQPVARGQQLLRSAAWVGAGNIVRVAAQGGALAVLAHLLSPREFGVVGMAGTVMALAVCFRDLGTASVLIREAVPDPRLASGLWWMNSLLGLGLALAIAVASPFAALFFHEPTMVPVLLGLAPSFLLAGVASVPMALMERSMRFNELSLIDTAAAVVGAVAAVAVAWNGGGVWALVAQQLALTGSRSLMLWRTAAFRPAGWRTIGAVRRVLGYSSPLLGSGLISYAIRNIDVMILGRWLGRDAVGVYGLAMQISLLPVGILAGAGQRVAFPDLCRSQADVGEVLRRYRGFTAVNAFAVFPVMLGLAACAWPATATLLGAKWSAVAPCLAFLAVAQVVHALISPTSMIYQLVGRTDLLLWNGLGFGAVSVTAYILGAHWGAPGMALAYLCAAGLYLVPGLLVPARLLNARLRDLLLPAVPALLCAVGMAALVALWCGQSTRLPVGLVLVAAITLGALAYVALSSIFCRKTMATLLAAFAKRR